MNHASHSTLAVQRPTALHLTPSPAPRVRPATVSPQHVFAAALLTLVGMGMTPTPQEESAPAYNAAVER